MAKKTCSKGHIYDSNIYGDNCPFCPSTGTGTVVNENVDGKTVRNFDAPGGTEMIQDGRTFVGGSPTNPTIPMGGIGGGGGVAGGTVIRPADNGTGTPSGRKLVGFLVTYNTTPTGQSFNIYEGKNFVGRDLTVNIPVQGDSQISGKHLSVLYRPADRKFKFKDEQSSNGTYVNEVLIDEGELNTYDVIRIGSTNLTFIAIPQPDQK
ncbi:MAG: FHA domain-containing protein [Tannerella sp.]|jgi:hypothetical protein|nr:FHA domain-containing protein [Tannerella sp.]